MLVRTDGTKDVIQSLRPLLNAPRTDAAARESYWRILADVGEANDLAAMLNIPDARMKAPADAIARRPSSSWAAHKCQA